MLPSRVLGDSYTFELGWETLESLVDTGTRMAGHEGETRAMEQVREAFQRAGVSAVDRHDFEFPAWFRGESSLAVPGRDREFAGSHQAIGLPGTPAGTERAELVDVGHGTPAEFEATAVDGSLVIASSGTPEAFDQRLHRREKYDMAAEGGAVGFLFRNHVPGCLPPTGDIGEKSGPGPIPAVGISRELGRRLLRFCGGSSLEAKLDVDARTEPAVSGNVTGRLGPETGSELLVTAHHDAHDIAEGAGDNGAGCAIVVTVASMLAAVEEQLELGVRFVTFGAEEVGLRGSRRMVERTELDGVEAVVNCDAIGSARDLGVYTHGFDALGAVFEDVGDDLGIPVEIRNEVEPHSDHWPFVREGVPGVMAFSAEESDDRGWGHTHGDTFDKVDRRDLRDLTIPIAEAVFRLAREEDGPEAVDSETIERRARNEKYRL